MHDRGEGVALLQPLRAEQSGEVSAKRRDVRGAAGEQHAFNFARGDAGFS